MTSDRYKPLDDPPENEEDKLVRANKPLDVAKQIVMARQKPRVPAF